MKKLLLALTLVSITGFAFARGTPQPADGTVKLTAYMQIDMADPQYEYWGVTLLVDRLV